MAQQYDVVIVGGGHNGLVAAAYLAREGLRTLVLERRHIVGGAAVSEQPFGPDFTLTSLSYVVSWLPPTLVRDLDLVRHGYHVYPQGPYFAPRTDGRYLQLPDDKRARHEQISKFSAKDADAAERWDEWMDGLGKILGPLINEIPPKVGSRKPADLARQALLLRKLTDVDQRKAVDLTRLLTSSAADLIEDTFESDAMRGVLSVSAVIGSWAGPRTPGTAYVIAHHHIGDLGDGRIGAWGFPKGGMGGVTQALAAAARSFGAEIRTEAPVARITTKAGAVTGVTLEDGTEISAPTVITTTHPQISFLRLVDRADLPADFVEDIERYKSRSGTVKINVALDRLPEFTSKPGFDPAVHGGTIVLSESLDEVETSFQEAAAGQAVDPAVRRHLHPERVRPHARPRGQARDEHVHAVGAAHLERGAPRRRARGVRRPALRAHGGSGSGLHRLGAAPADPEPVRHRARVRPDRRQHLPRRAHDGADVPRASRRRLRRSAHACARPLPVRLRHPRRRRRDGRARPQRRAPGARRPQARPVARQGAAREEELSVGELQAALPREHYVDDATHRVERERVLLREWTCIGRLDELGLTEPGSAALLPERLAVVDLLGESVLVTTTADGTLHAHYNVCRHRGSQVVPVEPDSAAPAPCAAKSLRCPYHSWTYALDGTLLHAPHTEDVPLPAFALHPVGAAAWGGWLWLNGTPDQAAPLLDALAPVPEQRTPLSARHPRARPSSALRGRGELEGHRGELQRVLPLRPGAPRALAPRARVRAAAAPTSTGRTAYRTARARGRSR